MRKNKRSIYHLLLSVFLLLVSLLPAKAADTLQISLLSCNSGEQIYERWGHTAIRVQNPQQGTDLVFNYGTFSFQKPNFVYHFVKGETDYMLGISSFHDFYIEWVLSGTQVYEQKLNLTPDQAQRLFDALIENSQPQNREYRYSFLYDNCATRPRWVIEKIISDPIVYPQVKDDRTFREILYTYLPGMKWTCFGIDLVLGGEVDQPISDPLKRLFLPMPMKEAFDGAYIKTQQGNIPLVLSSELITPDSALSQKDTRQSIAVSPLIAGLLFLLLIVLICLAEVRRKKIFPLFDTIVYTLFGLVGLLIYFLVFVSEHPATSPNWNAVWIHPFYFIPAILVWIKPARKILNGVHLFLSLSLGLFLIGMLVLPQHFSWAMVPFVLALLFISLTHLYLATKNRHGYRK